MIFSSPLASIREEREVLVCLPNDGGWVCCRQEWFSAKREHIGFESREGKQREHSDLGAFIDICRSYLVDEGFSAGEGKNEVTGERGG